jgi:methionyl aminopeptidase
MNMMNVQIKTPEEIAKMRVAGRLAAEVLEMIGPHVKPGVSTEELDRLCYLHIVEKQKAIPACLNYRGSGSVPFPKSICTSVNHVICHGIPNEKPLKSGDILNIDVTVIKDGYHGDTSKMFLVGDCSIMAQKLVRVTQDCLYKAIDIVKPGLHLSDIGAIIQKEAESHRYSVVREYCGHGIGSEFHEEAIQVLHYLETPKPGQMSRSGIVLKPGMTFTIEPMINAGKADIKYPQVKGHWDGWTVVTKDHSLSAQWEHTLLVTETGVEVLTRRQEESRFSS